MGRCPRGWPRAAMNRGDIYLVSLDPIEGREQQGFRRRSCSTSAHPICQKRIKPTVDLNLCLVTYRTSRAVLEEFAAKYMNVASQITRQINGPYLTSGTFSLLRAA